MKKVIIVILMIFIVSLITWQINLNYIPTGSFYEEQKKYAVDQYNKAARIREQIFFFPNIPMAKFLKNTVYIHVWKKAIKAYEKLHKIYPQRAEDDVDYWRGLADSYFYIKRYDKARPLYEKEIEVFKKKYFQKPYYPEKEGIDDESVEFAEFERLIRTHRSIAACYNAQSQFDKALNEYNKIISYLPHTKYINIREKYSLFNKTFFSIAKLYKIIFKDYGKAIETYARMKSEFPIPIAETESEIFIGDTYLAMGDIEKAKKIYQSVIDKYKPKKLGAFDVAERRLENIKNGKVIATDGVVYEIKDDKVNVRY